MLQLLLLDRLRRGQPLLVTATRWPPLLALAASVVIVVMSLLAGRGAILVARSLAVGDHESSLSPAAAAVLFLLAMQSTVIVLTTAAAALGRDGRLPVLPLTPSRKGGVGYAEALAGAVVLTALYTAIVCIAGLADIVADLQPFVGLMRSPLWPLAVVAIAIGAPVSEELLFRGFLLPALSRSRLGISGASVVSTLAWTGLHAGYSPAGMVEVFLIGLYFCWLLWRTGSLRVPLLCHAAINAVTLALIVAWLV